MKANFANRFSLMLALTFLFAMADSISPLLGQAITGDILGTVRDATGAVLPGVTVTLTNMDTNISTQTATDDAGSYVFSRLRPGRYQVSAELSGFKKATISDIRLLVDQRARVDITLEVGELTEELTVTAAAVLLDTDTVSLGQVIEEKRIKDLPLNGRNFMQLAHISAGVIPLGTGVSPVTSWTGRPDQSASISGQRESSNSYLVDGIETRNSRFGSTGIRPSVDAIQEFKIQRNTFSAEFGHGTAIINTAIKSGSNDLHATVFEFLRNDNFDARGFFDVGNAPAKTPLPEFRQNNFGFAASGPIRRDKAFVFGNYEGFRQRRARELKELHPTPDLLSGDFSSLPVRVVDPLTGVPFPGNRIPPERFSRVARNLIPFIPTPNLPGVDPRFNTVKTVSNINDWDQFHVRVDQKLSDKDTAFYRFSFADEEIFRPALPVLRGEKFPQRNSNVAINWTRTFTPQVINEFRTGYNRSKTFRVSEGAFGRNIAQEVGLRNTTTNPFSFGIPNISLNLFSAFGSIPQSIGAIEQIFQWTDNLSWIKGKHSLKMGFDIRRDRYFQDTNFAGNPSFSFTGQFACGAEFRTRGCAVADFLLGFPVSATAAVGDSIQNLRSTFWGFYIQDDWKVKPNLTLTLGLRYEYESPPYEIDNKQKYFDFKELRVKVAGEPGVRRSIVAPDRNNLGPRFGIAYNPTKKLVLRTGYGAYYDLVNWNEQQFHVIGPPFFQPRSFFSLPMRPTLFLDEMLPPLEFLFDPTQVIFTLDPGNRTPYVHQWSFNVQYELARDLLVEIGYAGSAGHKLGQRVNPNQGFPDPTGTIPLAERRPIRGFGDMLLTYNGGNSAYNEMTVRVDKRFSKGFSILSSYTWSKSIDFGHTDEFAGNLFNLKADRGLSTFDARHRFVTSYIWDLPFGKGRRLLSDLGGFSGWLISGWQINGITTFMSGQPQNAGFTGVPGPVVGIFARILPDRLGPVNCSECRAQIRKNPLPGPYIRLEDLRAPAPFTFGNAGRNIVIRPGLNNWDFSVFKNNRIAENLNLQFRAEFFNIFNHAQFAGVDATVGSPTYGLVTGLRTEARDIQFALRLEF